MTARHFCCLRGAVGLLQHANDRTHQQKTFEFTGGIFHEEVHQEDHPYRQVRCHLRQDRRGQFHVCRACLQPPCVCSNAGEGYIDTAVKVLIAVVLGALVLAGLYAILNDTVMPTVTQKITEMFSYNG